MQNPKFKIRNLNTTPRPSLLRRGKGRFAPTGQLLVEAILAIALLGVLAGIVGMAVNVSTQSNKASGKKTVAVALAQEAIEAVRAIRDNNETTGRGWNRIYEKNKGSGNIYYPANTVPLCGSAIWCLVSGSEEIIKDGVTYTRSLYVDNVCRDAKNGGGDIAATGTCNETTNFSDPSTQYIKVTVTASGISGIILEEYLTRAKNEAKVWDTQGQFDQDGSSTASCSNTKIKNVSGGEIQLESGVTCL